jgi:pyrroline-5-carboxylate reductase
MIDRIGFVGTGAIAEAIVDGLGTDGPSVFLSPRNARTADALARRHPNVRVCEDNQAVVDAAPVVLLTVRPDSVGEVLGELRVPGDRVLISAVAGWSVEALRARLDADVPIVRAIPLPAVRQRRGITAVYPAHPVAQDVFGPLGGTLVAPDPETFDALSAATATISTHLHYLDTIAHWVTLHGVEPREADRYVRGMFAGIGADDSIPLAELAGAHETPGGVNEALRTNWFDPRNKAALERALDDIRQRVADNTLGRTT